MFVTMICLAASLAGGLISPPPHQGLPAPDRLNGVWDLNTDLSTAPPASPGEGRSGPSEGGPGGRRGGGRPGGGMGRGGRPGGASESREARAALAEFDRAPRRWMISLTAGTLSLTDGDGVVRRFAPTGKKEKVAMNGEAVEVKTAWDGDVLTQSIKGGGVTITRTLETTVEGRQLVVTVTAKGGPGGAPLRYVYDRAEIR